VKKSIEKAKSAKSGYSTLPWILLQDFLLAILPQKARMDKLEALPEIDKLNTIERTPAKKPAERVFREKDIQIY